MFTLFIIILKVIISFFLLSLFIAGIFKANPKTHNPNNRPIAEYMAGFICCFGSAIGFYYLWFY